MTNALYRLVYLSTNQITGKHAVIDEQLCGILETSRRNNMQAGVTGALMFNAGCFAQVLEGPHDAIQDTFERIQCDERHSDATVLLFEPSETRAFSNWAMAYVGKSMTSEQQFSIGSDESGFDFSVLDGDAIYRALRANLHEAESLG